MPGQRAFTTRSLTVTCAFRWKCFVVLPSQCQCIVHRDRIGDVKVRDRLLALAHAPRYRPPQRRSGSPNGLRPVAVLWAGAGRPLRLRQDGPRPDDFQHPRAESDRRDRCRPHVAGPDCALGPCAAQSVSPSKPFPAGAAGTRLAGSLSCGAAGNGVDGVFAAGGSGGGRAGSLAGDGADAGETESSSASPIRAIGAPSATLSPG